MPSASARTAARRRGRRCRGGRRRGGRPLALERRRRHDRPGRRAGCERRGARGRRRLRAPGERLLEQRPQLFRALVLQVVHVEARTVATAGLVESLDPLLHFVEIRRLRRDHEQRVHPLDGDDAQDARERTRRAVADHLVEFLADDFDVGVLQREHADRHARHPVDVEHVDGVEQVLQLDLGAGKDQHVAQLVGAHCPGVLGERLEHAQHFAHADIAQRHDQHRESGRQGALRIAELRRDVAAHRRRARQDLVDPRLLDHRRAIHPQQHLERRRQRFARNARRRADRDLSPDRRVDRVALVQDVAEDVADDLAQVGSFEIQDDAAPGLLHGGPQRDSPLQAAGPSRRRRYP